MPALSECEESKDRLDSYLVGCFSVQKMYGRSPENMKEINEVFHSVLKKYPAHKVLKAFEVWIERSQEFPTPADIVNLIKRGGRAPITKEVYIAASKKDPELRDAGDWQILKEYETAQKYEEFGSEDDLQVLENFKEENNRLRQLLKESDAEIKRLGKLALEKQAERVRAPLKALIKPKLSVEERINRTVLEMRELGAPEQDIQEFMQSFNGLANAMEARA